MSIANNIKAVNEAARKVHGSDINIMVVRCIAMGHDDNLAIVTGKNHKAAALDFVRSIKGAEIKEVCHPAVDWGDGEISEAYTTSEIYF